MRREMNTQSVHISRERPQRFWLREALIALGIVAFALFAIGLPSVNSSPTAAVPAELQD
jgi:hypothetical protein